MSLTRSLQMVPGTDDEAVDALQDAPADVTAIDLEDSVTTANKDDALENAIEALADWTGVEKPGIRVNGMDTTRGIADVEALLSEESVPSFLIVPDVRGPTEIRVIEDIIAKYDADVDILPLIEGPSGVFSAQEIAHSTDRVFGLMFGAIDFKMNMGISVLEDSNLAFPRFIVAMAAKSANVVAFDTGYLHLEDDEGLRRQCHEAREYGYDGKLAATAEQAEIINDAFTPSSEDVSEARRLLKSFKASDEGFVDVDGVIVDKPVVEQLETLVDRAREAGVDIPTE